MTDDAISRRRHPALRPKRPRRIPGMWARAGLSVAIIAVSLFFAVCLVAKAIKPYREASRQKAQLAQTLHQSDLLAGQNTQLERRVAYLRTPDGVASEARRMGYLRPGEYPLVVEGLAGRSELGVSQSETLSFAPSAPEVSPLRRFLRHLTGH